MYTGFKNTGFVASYDIQPENTVGPFSKENKNKKRKSISADKLRNASSSKIDHIALHAKCNYQATSIASDI